MIIPAQLHNQRFIKVDDSKRPIEKAWQQIGGANYSITDQDFIKWVEDNKRYGVLCGYPNNLVVIDFDDEITQREVLEEGILPPTFTQKTARKGLLHLFYYVDDPTPWKLMDKEKNTLADIQGTGKQVIGPGTRIADGREYKVVNDIPIATISTTLLHKVLDKFDYNKVQEKLQEVTDGLTLSDFEKSFGDDKALAEVRRQLKINDILRDASIPTSRNPTKCPFHSSKGGKCLSFSNERGIWNCFHCSEHGTAIDLWMKINNVSDFVDAKKQLCEKFGIKDTFVIEKKQLAAAPINDLPMVRLPSKNFTNPEFAAEVSKYFVGCESIFFKPDEKNIVEITDYEDKLSKKRIVGFSPIDFKRLVCLVEERVNTYNLEYVKKEEVMVRQSPNEQTISILSKQTPFINALYKIKRFLNYPMPFIDPKDGLIVPKHYPGKGIYDDRFQAYFTPDTPELKLLTIAEAKYILDDILGEFCFKDEVDKVMSKAYIITPMCRGLYSRPTTRTPIFIIQANRERSGKDYLAGCRGIIYEGQAVDDNPIVTGEKYESNNDELRKKLTAALKSGKRLYHSSNNKGFLNNSVFEQFTTSEVWRDRELGKSVYLELNNEIDVSLSANIGLTYTPDLHHRSRPINLFYSQENPNERVYKRTDLHGYILQNRALILSAIYTLIKAWYDAGQPPGKTPFTSFPEWSKIVGGIMSYHNLGDPCVTFDDTNIGGDRETAAIKELAAYMGLYQEADMTLKNSNKVGYTINEIRRIVIDAHSTDDLEGFGGWDFNDKSIQIRFGLLIKRFVGREFHCKQQIKFRDKDGCEEFIHYKVTLHIAKDNDRSNKILYGFTKEVEGNKQPKLDKPIEVVEQIVEERVEDLMPKPVIEQLTYKEAERMLLSILASGGEVYTGALVEKGISDEQIIAFINSGIVYESKPGYVRLLQ